MGCKSHLEFLTSSNTDLPSNEQTLLGISVQPPGQICKKNGSWFIFSTESGFCFHWHFWPGAPGAPITFTHGGNFHDVAFSLPSWSGPISHFPSHQLMNVPWGGQVWVLHKVHAWRNDVSVKKIKKLLFVSSLPAQSVCVTLVMVP